MIKLKKLAALSLFAAGLLLTATSAQAQNNPLTHKFSYDANKTAVQWVTGAWGTCGGNPCDYGEQNRTVECRDNMNNLLADADCLAITAKPDEVQQCDLPSCSWQTTPWGPCTAGQTSDPDIDVDVDGSAENVERFINNEFQYDECNPEP